MPIWKWKEKFTDCRDCAVEADNLNEALEKMKEGDWLYEDTYDFYSEGLLSDLTGPHED